MAAKSTCLTSMSWTEVNSMGRNTTRWFIKRDMKQAQARLDKVEDYLARCGSLYHADHPQIYQGFCTCLILTRMLKEALEKLGESI